MAERVAGAGLARAGLPRVVEVAGARFEVPPPTVRQVVEVRALLASAADGEAEDLLALGRVLAAWLPAPLVAVLEAAPIGAAVRWILRWLDAGVELPAPPRAGGDAAAGERSGAPDLLLLLADYCQVYGADPWRAYDETPWPFFILALARLRAAAARELLRWAEVEILPHTGKAAGRTLRSLQARARGPREAEALFAPREVIERDRAALREALAGGAYSARNNSGRGEG